MNILSCKDHRNIESERKMIISSELDILIRPLNMFALQYFAFIRDDGEVSGVYFTAWAAEVMLLALVAIVDIIIVDLSTRMGINYFSSNNVASKKKLQKMALHMM